LRIDVIFRDSDYGLSPSNFVLGYILIALNVITIAISLPLFWEGSTQTLNGVVYCNPSANIIFWFLILIWDFGLSTGLIFVFIYKMGQVNRNIEHDDEKSANASILIILKYSMLGSVAICSTIINLSLTAQFNWVWPGAIDSIISSLCIYLTYAQKNKKRESKMINFLSQTCCCCFLYCCCRNILMYSNNHAFNSVQTITSTSTSPKLPTTTTSSFLAEENISKDKDVSQVEL